MLDIADVLGKRIVTTRLHRNVTIREENADGGARSDEPLRGQPEVADLPAADDVAQRDDEEGRPARASGRSILVLPGKRRIQSRRRAEAHGVSRHPHCVQEQGCRARAIWNPEEGVFVDEKAAANPGGGRGFLEDWDLERELLGTI